MRRRGAIAKLVGIAQALVIAAMLGGQQGILPSVFAGETAGSGQEAPSKELAEQRLWSLGSRYGRLC